MTVPKRKRSHSRKRIRHANWGVEFGSISVCPSCKAPILPHTVCSECGYYRGRKVIRTRAERAKERFETRKKIYEARQKRMGGEASVPTEGEAKAAEGSAKKE